MTFDPDADPRAFRDALGTFPTGVCLVTCRGEAGPVGFTVNSFASLSLAPPLILWSPAKASRRAGAFVGAARFALHVLSTRQEGIAQTFTRDAHAFAGLGAEEVEGVPLLPGCAARFECRTHAVHDGGDHHLILGRVLRGCGPSAEPLAFRAGAYGRFTPAA